MWLTAGFQFSQTRMTFDFHPHFVSFSLGYSELKISHNQELLSEWSWETQNSLNLYTTKSDLKS